MTGEVSAWLSVGSIQWIDGTYGAGCVARSGSWSLRVSGAAAMDYAALSVIKNNTACTLMVTSIIADHGYTTGSSMALAASYQAVASKFTSAASATLTATKDTYVQYGTNTNFGTSGTLVMKWQGATSNVSRNDWIAFDISAYPSISSAVLGVYLGSMGAENTLATPVRAYYAPTASDSCGRNDPHVEQRPLPRKHTRGEHRDRHASRLGSQRPHVHLGRDVVGVGR